MSDKELELKPDQLLIIKTTTSGKMTYCNQSFIQLSGYSEQQWLNQPLEMFKHQHMPKGIFQLMWKTLKKNGEFNGFFKNKTHNGDHFWALTNIKPFYDISGQLGGYTCSMRQANPAAAIMFSMYYEQMQQKEAEQQNKDGTLDPLTDLLSATGDDYEACVFKLQFS